MTDEFPLTPPENFGVVETGIFRSNALHASNFSFLDRYTSLSSGTDKPARSLKTAILLSPEVPTRSVVQYLENRGVQFIHLGLHGNTANNSAVKSTGVVSDNASWRPISDELVKEAMELILNKKTHPVLIFCTSGVYETGTFVGCLRKLQRWGMNAILSEYRAYAGARARYLNEQFIELFDLDLVCMPERDDLPQFLIEQFEADAEERAITVNI